MQPMTKVAKGKKQKLFFFLVLRLFCTTEAFLPLNFPVVSRFVHLGKQQDSGEYKENGIKTYHIHI